jgi:hypothetical protein
MKSFNKSKAHRRASPQACKRSHTLDDSSSSSSNSNSGDARSSSSNRSGDSVYSRKWNDNDGIGSDKKRQATSKSGASFQKDLLHSRQRAKLGDGSGREIHRNTTENNEGSSSSSDESSSSNEQEEDMKVGHQAQRTSEDAKLRSLKRKKSGDKGCRNMEFCSNHGKVHA